MIQAADVARSFGGRRLFDGVDWHLGPGARVGLVGPNGAGKTTLCRILAGLDAPDEGVVSRPRGSRVGYLPQEVVAPREGTVLDAALAGFADLRRLEVELEAATALLAATAGAAREIAEPTAREVAEPTAKADVAELTARYGELQHRFEALGGYTLEARARVILGGLGFAAEDHTKPLAGLSGGWRSRAALAGLLLERPELLLLDEPTNHLDLPALAWLEEFLAGYPGAVVLVSHDRFFLNRMATSIAELGPDGLETYPGGWDDYLLERAHRRALAEARARAEDRRVAEIERFVERFRYKATKARQVQSRLKQLARLERTATAGPERRVRVRFPDPPRTGRRVLALAGLHKAYGAKVVYAGVDFELERGERVALVGPNGAGKSTLLKIVAGVLPFERGERMPGAQVTVHYYAQHQLDQLDATRTAFEELEAAAPELARTRLRALLGMLRLQGDDADKRVGILSGGEKARVALARMLVRPAALLALDEPTNHLDVASREALEAALDEFAGTIVFISHDRYFINRLATRVVEVAAGALTSYPGDYDDWMTARARAVAAPAPALAAGPGAVSSATSRARQRPGRAAVATGAVGSATSRAARRRLEEVEGRIAELEDRLRAADAELGDPALYRDGARARAVATDRALAAVSLTELVGEWERLSTEVAHGG